MHRSGVLVFFFTIIFLSCSFSQNNRTVDSLKKVLSSSKLDTNKVVVLSRLCDEFSNSDPNEALVYGHLGQSLAVQLKYKKGIAMCLGKIGSVYNNQGDYENALINYLEALKIGEAIEDQKCIADNLANVGSVYRTQKKFEKSLEYQYRALKIDEQQHNKLAVATDQANIGNVYYDAENFQKAMIYYQKALKAFQELSDEQGIATVLNNIGSIYFNRQKFQMAVENFARAMKIYETQGDKIGVAMDLNNIAEVYAGQNKNDSASKYYKKSLLIAKETKAKDIQKYNYIGLSELAAKMNDFRAAYEYHKLYFDMNDSLLNAETSTRINEMAIKYETEKKEKENIQLKKENTKQNFLNQHQKEIGNYMMLGLVAVSLIGINLYTRSRRKEKEKAKLERIVSERTSELKNQNKQKELMLQEIHHRVKNNLQLISSLLRLQTSYKGDKDVDEILANCSSRIKCMAILHDKLCQANDYSEINSQQYFTELAGYVSGNYDNSSSIKIDIDAEPLTLHINKLIPCGLIINELVSNAYKYAFAENDPSNFIRVSFRKEAAGNNYHLMITDNGKGLPANFDAANQSGLGLIIVQSLVEQLDGKITFAGSNGTHISVLFPV